MAEATAPETRVVDVIAAIAAMSSRCSSVIAPELTSFPVLAASSPPLLSSMQTERFFLDMSGVQRAKTRVQALLFRGTFSERTSELWRKISVMHRACEEMMTSDRFKVLLKACVGSRMRPHGWRRPARETPHHPQSLRPALRRS